LITAVLTGRVHVGKTTICREVVRRARARGYIVRGLLTLPALDADGTRLGLELLDLESGKRRLLASIHRDLGGPRVGPHHFDPVTLQWGESILVAAHRHPCDLLAVDEIGRLELEQNSGFQGVLAVLASDLLPRSLVLVRDTLLEVFRRRLPELQFTTFEAAPGNCDRLPVEILQFLFDTRPG
jgi:nucleoside-triphosphatase THEP1